MKIKLCKLHTKKEKGIKAEQHQKSTKHKGIYQDRKRQKKNYKTNGKQFLKWQ